jgi:NADH:ubiquinone oxidoreductase subunit 6 (subunit J)
MDTLNFFILSMFYILILLTIWFAISVANPVYAVLYLILAFIGVAGLLIYLSMDYLAILFVLIYAGAISILILFVIMMLDLKEIEFKKRSLL